MIVTVMGMVKEMVMNMVMFMEMEIVNGKGAGLGMDYMAIVVSMNIYLVVQVLTVEGETTMVMQMLIATMCGRMNFEII